jgi:hypothetical protein
MGSYIVLLDFDVPRQVSLLRLERRRGDESHPVNPSLLMHHAKIELLVSPSIADHFRDTRPVGWKCSSSKPRRQDPSYREPHRVAAGPTDGQRSHPQKSLMGFGDETTCLVTGTACHRQDDSRIQHPVIGLWI